MLYRPPFVSLCQQSNDPAAHRPHYSATSNIRSAQDRLPNRLADQCSIACIENAEALVEHINTTSRGDQTGARWFNAYCTFSFPSLTFFSLLSNPGLAAM